MKQQVLSIKQMQHLKDLGVDTSKASIFWRRRIRGLRGEEVKGEWNLSFNTHIIGSNFETHETIPTFTLQDILDMLPICIEKAGVKYELRIKRMVFDSRKVMYAVLYEEQDYIDWYIMQSYENLLDSVYEMLLWCIQNGYVETKKED